MMTIHDYTEELAQNENVSTATFEQCKAEVLAIIEAARAGKLSDHAPNNREIAADLQMLWNIRTGETAVSPLEGAQWVLKLAQDQKAKCEANKAKSSGK